MTAFAPPLDPSAIDADLNEFYELSYQLSLLARRQMQAALAVYNLTPPQYAVIKTVAGCQNSISVTALAEANHQLMSTTPAGQAILTEFGQTIRAGVKSLLAEISPTDRQNLLQSIRTLKDKFETSLTPLPKEDLSVD